MNKNNLHHRFLPVHSLAMADFAWSNAFFGVKGTERFAVPGRKML